MSFKDVFLLTAAISGGIYGCIGAGYAVYFNYIVLKEDGFWAWLILGEIIATFKGFLWPFYM
mgnify:FL=1